MTRKLAGAVIIGAAAVGILTATAVPALGHEPRFGEPDKSPSMGMMGADSMGSMDSMMGPDEVNGTPGPVDEDGAADPVDHQAHHPAAIPEPTK